MVGGRGVQDKGDPNCGHVDGGGRGEGREGEGMCLGAMMPRVTFLPSLNVTACIHQFIYFTLGT